MSLVRDSGKDWEGAVAGVVKAVAPAAAERDNSFLGGVLCQAEMEQVPQGWDP
jgi:hypothetical protein